MDYGASLAFFEAPDMPFDFKPQHDFDLHIVLEVSQADFEGDVREGHGGRRRQTRGITDHHIIHSIYFRDPNGYVIESTARAPGHDEAMDPAHSRAAEKLRGMKEK